MKRLIYLFGVMLIAFTACDDAGDGVVDSVSDNLVVQDINAPTSFTKTLSDSIFTTEVILGTNSYAPAAVWMNIKESTGGDILRRNISLYDDGNTAVSGDAVANDKKYSMRITMSALDPSGKYSLEYYYSDANNSTRKLSVLQIQYDNGQNNLPPEIINVVAPDSIIVVAPKSVALLAADVEDFNGYRDIGDVWFTVTRPDGTSNGFKFYMLDDGKDSSGDAVSGDGRFSILIEAVPGQTLGNYIFNFRASDKSGNLSEIISHTITIIE